MNALRATPLRNHCANGLNPAEPGEWIIFLAITDREQPTFAKPWSPLAPPKAGKPTAAGPTPTTSKLNPARAQSPSSEPLRLSQRSASRQVGQTSSTRAQKREEWFISRRCISS